MTDKPARLSRVAALAYWTFPSLFCLWLYWYGLFAWFTEDDFAWLGLNLHVTSFETFWATMFTPKAQGTIRPWSERGFFMLFSWLFGLDALPYRIWVLITQFANLMLLSSITRKLTGSLVAGFAAPILWTANACLAVPLSWTSSYNQVLCAFFLLAAFRVFLRYTETGRMRDYVAQFLLFLLGFGALELNVVYPALAAAYALCCARKYLLHTLPMFGVSAAYALLHRSLSLAPSAGVYSMHYDPSIFSTLGVYTFLALGPGRFGEAYRQWQWVAPYATAFIAIVLSGFAVWKMWRGKDGCSRWLPVFFLAWFLIVLGPVLPLRNHLSEYYLTIPTAGLAAFGAWGIACAWRSHWGWRTLSIAVAGLYLVSAIPVARQTTMWTYQLSESLRRVVLGVERAHEIHPGKTILLADVGSNLFWKGIVNYPFRLLGIQDVYIAPGTETNIEAHPELGSIEEFVFPARMVAGAIDRKKVVVYSAAGPVLRNITREYREVIATKFPSTPPKRVDVGNSVFDEQLGPGWHQNEGGFRWMSKRAIIRLAGPDGLDEKLHVSGMCHTQQFQKGPIGIQVRVNGQSLLPATLMPGRLEFDLVWPLPPSLVGTKLMEVEIEVERTIIPPEDGRELGLAFGSFSVRP